MPAPSGANASPTGRSNQQTSASREETCAKEIISTLVRRAFRRPTTAEDLEGLLGFYQEGRKLGTFEDGIELALRRILASPQFLVRAGKGAGESGFRSKLSYQ